MFSASLRGRVTIKNRAAGYNEAQPRCSGVMKLLRSFFLCLNEVKGLKEKFLLNLCLA